LLFDSEYEIRISSSSQVFAELNFLKQESPTVVRAPAQQNQTRTLLFTFEVAQY